MKLKAKRGKWVKFLEENRCLECNRVFNKLGGLMAHVPRVHSLKKEQYYYKHAGRRKNKVCEYKRKFGRCFGSGTVGLKKLVNGYNSHCSHKCHQKNPRIIKQKKQTCLDRYGVDNVTKVPEIKARVTKSFMTMEVRKKGFETRKNHSRKRKALTNKRWRRTCTENFGADHPTRASTNNEKVKKTALERYGVTHHSKDTHVRKKISKTLQKKTVTERKQRLNRFEETCLRRFGVKNPIQNPDIQAKSVSNNGYTRKKYLFEDGWYIYCQGYEPFAYDLLEKQGLADSIVDKPTAVSYADHLTGADRVYHPDIELCVKGGRNKLIEVKSIFTLLEENNDTRSKFATNLIKKNASMEAGFDHEIWVFGRRGNLLSVF